MWEQDRQCTCKRNTRRVLATIVAVENAISITYSEYVFLDLGISHAMRIRHIVVCGLSGCTVFSTFDIQMSVHRKHISKLQPTRCNVSWFIYLYRRSSCFRRFLRPSSGAHNCAYSFRYCQPLLLLVAIAAVLVDNTWSCMYSYVFLMMGGGTAWSM